MSGEPASARMIGSVTSVSISQRAARPFRVDDDLRIGDVGDGVERRGAQRVDAERRRARRRATQTSQRKRMTRSMMAVIMGEPVGYEPFSLWSASMKKLPNVTTCSPALSPSAPVCRARPEARAAISRGT